MDRYGIPILKYESVKEAQVQLGAGPLHTQFDHEGYAYTSLFIESAVAKWSLDAPKRPGDKPWSLVDKISIHYNIGHICASEGDTVAADGRYVVALNKWSVDRFVNTGPLHPQNFQLIDPTGEKMELLVDCPIGVGEPHYVQMMRVDRLKTWKVYPPGTDTLTMEKHPKAITEGEERIDTSRPGVTEVYMSLTRSHFTPDVIPVKKGDHVVIHLTNIETAEDATHGFTVPDHNIQLSIDPGETITVEFDAKENGSYSMYCTEFCSALHLEMQGWILVSD